MTVPIRRIGGKALATAMTLAASLLVSACTSTATAPVPGNGVADPSAVPASPERLTTREWRVSGERSVRPQSVRDDGARITIIFAPDQALPAVFAIDPNGEEMVVNGYMRPDGFVIDRLFERLVFRLDRARAEARRPRGEDAERP